MATREDLPDSLLDEYDALTPEEQVQWLERLTMFPGLKERMALEEARATAHGNLRGAVATLRGWANDIRSSPPTTTQNIVNQFQVMKDRQAIFFDRFADLLAAEGRGD